MGEHVTRQQLSDDHVRTILTAAAEVTNAHLGRQLGVSADTVALYRRRRSKRAIRIARQLGLIDQLPPRTGWMGKGAFAVRTPA